jgi:micrococcal nuclease
MDKNSIVKVLALIIIALFIVFQGYTFEEDIEQEKKVEGITNNIEDTTYTVTRVVDGDTIKVEDIGTIRLIGIDTPETVNPRKEVECFGKEASEKAKELLEGKKIKIELDSSQGEVDRYGRVLAYVYMEDGRLFNEVMIREGYAFEYTYRTPYKYQTLFKDAEKLARDERVGLWGDVCNY